MDNEKQGEVTNKWLKEKNLALDDFQEQGSAASAMQKFANLQALTI
jgi:hypothetical protein